MHPQEFDDQALLNDLYQQLPANGEPPLPGQQSTSQPPAPEPPAPTAPAIDPNELATLRSQVAQLQQALYQRQTPPPQAPSPTPHAPAVLPQRWDPDQWATAMQRDPISGTDETLAQAMGLPPGTKASQILTGMATLLQQQNAKLEEVQNAMTRAEQAQYMQRVELEANQFLNSHPEYEASIENWNIIQDYMRQYNLPPTRASLEVVYKAAIADGKFKTAKEEPPAPTAPRLPSIRQSSSGPGEPSIEDIISKLDQLPQDQAFAYIDKFRNRLR